MLRIVWAALAIAGALLQACGGDGDRPADAGDAALPTTWAVVHEGLPGALMSVWGTSADDVWAVGGDPDATVGGGPELPTVLHWDGTRWTQLDPGVDDVDLWWVFGFADGPVYLGGADGTILRHEDGVFTKMETPGNQVVFGIWGSSPDDLWAVGAQEGGSTGGFAWRLEGDVWVEAEGFPAEVADTSAVWKIDGNAPDDVWMVGTGGLVVHWDGEAFEEVNVGGGESLFTVDCEGGTCAAVGGFATGLIFENPGTGWSLVSAPDAPALVGVRLIEGGGGWAVGSFGEVMERQDGSWVSVEPPGTQETLHSVWVDPTGAVWAAGGQVQAYPLIRGVLTYLGLDVPAGAIER